MNDLTPNFAQQQNRHHILIFFCQLIDLMFHKIQIYKYNGFLKLIAHRASTTDFFARTTLFFDVRNNFKIQNKSI